MEKFAIGWVLFVVTMQGLLIWGGASAVTSGVKKLSDECGKTYFVEKVVAGNWFCEEE